MKGDKPSLITTIAAVVGIVGGVGGVGISLRALNVSSAAYENTLVTQREEREYRELLIRPGLSRGFEMSDYSVRIKNGGLGPAWIKRIGGHFSDRCFVFDRKDDEGFVDFYNNHLAPFILRRLVKALEQGGIKLDDKFRVQTRSSMRLPRALLHKDEEMILVALLDEDAAMIKKLVREHQAEKHIMKEFYSTATSIPLFIDYCSITEKWCYNEDTDRLCLR